MELTGLWGYQAANLLAGKQLCAACVKAEGDEAGKPVPTNALVVDVDTSATVHAGDVITGITACGLNANTWTWIVPARPDVAGAIEQP